MSTTIAKETYSPREVAQLCGVGKSTVTHWIRSRKLAAHLGRGRYQVSKVDLRLFLEKRNKPLPTELANDAAAPFRTLCSCWEYWKNTPHENGCNASVVRGNHLDVCFSAKESRRLQCNTNCEVCRYFQDVYAPRVQLVHQFRQPAMICHNLVVLGANQKWADLCKMQPSDLPGISLHELVRPDTLESLLSNFSRIQLGEAAAAPVRIALKNTTKGAPILSGELHALSEPAGSVLLVTL